MLYLHCSHFYADKEKITNENLIKFHDLVLEENKSLLYYGGLYNIISTAINDKALNSFTGRKLLECYAQLCQQLLYMFHYDPITENKNHEDLYTKIFDILFRLVKKTINSKITKSQKQCVINGIKKRCVIIPGYTWDDAFEILNSKKQTNEKYSLFVKTILLSNDFFNIDRIYELRERLLKTKYLNKLCKNFNSTHVEKDLFDMFFSDYKMFTRFMKIDIYSDYNCENFSEPFCEYVLFFVYSKFLLNMFFVMYATRMQYSFSEKTASKKLISSDIELKLDIFLNKISTSMDEMLFNMALEYMSDNEIINYFLKKIYEDVLFHVQNEFSLEKMARYSSFLIGFTHTINSNVNNKIIDDMSNIALNEWKNGNTISHIEMIEFLRNKDEKFASALKERGVETKLKKRLIQICRENYFPYIQGEHIHKRVKREKSVSKKGEKQENKKRTKKMA